MVITVLGILSKGEQDFQDLVWTEKMILLQGCATSIILVQLHVCQEGGWVLLIYTIFILNQLHVNYSDSHFSDLLRVCVNAVVTINAVNYDVLQNVWDRNPARVLPYHINNHKCAFQEIFVPIHFGIPAGIGDVNFWTMPLGDCSTNASRQ